MVEEMVMFDSLLFIFSQARDLSVVASGVFGFAKRPPGKYV
jgi:hypothetical protein